MLWITQAQRELEGEILSDISMDTIFAHVKSLAQWVRDSGTEDAGKAFMYIKNILEDNGVRVETYSLDAFLSLGGEAELKVLSPQDKTVEALAHAFSGSTGGEGLEGVLLDAEGITEEEAADLDLEGKILLNPEISYPVAEKMGVRAFLLPHFIPQEVPHRSQVKEIWGSPTHENMDKLAHIPILSITKRAGEFLKELCSTRQVRVWIRTSVTREWGKINLPVAVIEGTEEPEKFVLVGAHYDGWWLGATDNATGVSGMMELARVLNDYRDRLKRSVRIAFWPGHSTGTYAGSTWYADNFWEDLYENILVFVHHDIVGRKEAGLPLRARLHSEVKELLQATVKESTGEELLPNRWGHTGDQSFWGIGVPSFATAETYPREIVRERGRGDWWWHTPEDTMDKVDMGNLEMMLKTDAVSILRICNAPVLPFKFEGVAEDFIVELSELQGKGGEAIDLTSTIEKAEILKRTAAELDNIIAEIRTRYGDTENFSEKEDIGVINKALMRLSRILIPVLYTTSGRFAHDPPARKIKFLPLLQSVEELSALNPESGQFKALKTKLVRERNQVTFSLNEALRTIKETIARVTEKDTIS
jgi:Zn-dependent M28 family amino/carboxypeptidase